MENNKLTIITLRSPKIISDFAHARNQVLQTAETEWVLFIDSDEEVSPALAREIRDKISETKFREVGFYIRRRDRFLGRWLKLGETGNVKIIRLARKDSGQWEGPVHEIWNIKGRVGELKNPIYHYHDSIEEMIEKMDRYSSIIEAEWRLGRLGPPAGGLERLKILGQMILFPVGKFVWNYFFKLGFLDGMEGFILAGLMSFHSFLVRSKQLTRYESETAHANDTNGIC